MNDDDCEADKTIRRLEALLESPARDQRWEAAAQLTDFATSKPYLVWPIVVRLGSSADEDLRQAVATCILEHVLEHYFVKYFPLLEKEIERGNPNLRDTLKLSWKLGQAETPENAKRWDKLLEDHKP